VLIDHRFADVNSPAVRMTATVAPSRPDVWRRFGDWLLLNQRAIRRTQWGVVAVYLLLLITPAALPLPDRLAHIWNNLTLFAQLVFWGIWWPFVLLSMVLVGRMWCGLLCPEGALTEFASRHGRGHAIPRWITWGGWPFAAFVCTTVYGQMVSVYQYPAPALLILGGSTLAAIGVGALFGRGKRVWCRFLCPVSGVFGVLSKLAPLHFEVDAEAWRISQLAPKRSLPRINCAPLVPIRTMRGTSQCHMCGRCSGFRGAVTLARRSPNHEIVNVAGSTPKPWETVLIVAGMLGVAAGAFHWSVSPWFIVAKQSVAAWLVGRDILWPLEISAPWWILTNYPDCNDVLTLLDGAMLLAYVFGTAAVLSAAICAALGIATAALGRWSWPRFHHLAQSLIPLAGCGVFLGLSALSVTLLRGEGLRLEWVGAVRIALIAGASLWSLWLASCIGRRYTASRLRRTASVLAIAGAIGAADVSSALLFWVW
jgi:polyferredoxin